MSQEKARDVYMSMVTELFSKDLGAIQKVKYIYFDLLLIVLIYRFYQKVNSEGPIDEHVIRELTYSLEAGFEIFDDVEKEILATMSRPASKPKQEKLQIGNPNGPAKESEPKESSGNKDSKKRKRDSD